MFNTNNEKYKNPTINFNYECIRDFCGYISQHTDSHLDNEIWTRNLLLLKYFPKALINYCEEHKGDPEYCSDYSEWKQVLGNPECLYDMNGDFISNNIIKGASEELSFDDISNITDALYVNGVPTEVESIAYNLIYPEMHSYGFNHRFVHFN